MKKSIAGILSAIIVIVSAAIACAEKSPVVLKHTLTGYSEGDNGTVLEYVLQVRNQGDLPLAKLSLSLVPRPPLMLTVTTVAVGNLGPRGTAEVKVKSRCRTVRDQGYFSRTPLSFAGKYTSSDGKVIEFPVQSGPGGAQ